MQEAFSPKTTRRNSFPTLSNIFRPPKHFPNSTYFFNSYVSNVFFSKYVIGILKADFYKNKNNKILITMQKALSHNHKATRRNSSSPNLLRPHKDFSNNKICFYSTRVMYFSENVRAKFML